MENWILTRSGWCFRLSGVQLLLVFPCGKARSLVFPIEQKLARIDARGAMGLPLSVHRRGTHYFNPKAYLAVDQHPSTHIACIDEMLSWREISLEQFLLNASGASPHREWRASVVATCVIRWGKVCSHVSVR